MDAINYVAEPTFPEDSKIFLNVTLVTGWLTPLSVEYSPKSRPIRRNSLESKIQTNASWKKGLLE